MSVRRIFGALLFCIALLGVSRHERMSSAWAGHVLPQVLPDAMHDVSPPLREMVRRADSFAAGRISSEGIEEEEDLSPVAASLAAPLLRDPAQQLFPGSAFGAITLLNFDGIGQNNKWIAPDTNGAAGATQFIEWVNVEYSIYNKTTGSLVLGPVPGNTLWSGFGGACSTSNSGDVIAEYDKLASRWVMAQHATPGADQPFQCVAVSTTSDATGSWYRYAFPLPLGQLPDYPKLGVWPDAYYFSTNQAVNNVLIGAYACALNRTAMLAGLSATEQCFQQSDTVTSLLPSDVDGLTPPPTGSPNYFMNLGANALNLYKFHVDFQNPFNTTFTGPTVIPVDAFTQACGDNSSCVPQKGTANKLTTLGDRLMYRLAYRNFGAHESLVVNHAVINSAGGVGIRWYEIRSPDRFPTVFQQATYAPDEHYRFMGSIAMDKLGDIALGYTESAKNTYPSPTITGRLFSDTLDTLETEHVVTSGLGSQTSSYRWGDYSSMAVDPVDDCTFWYSSEYLKISGSKNWSTRLISFRFKGCP
jgi:hypothetical protein